MNKCTILRSPSRTCWWRWWTNHYQPALLKRDFLFVGLFMGHLTSVFIGIQGNTQAGSFSNHGQWTWSNGLWIRLLHSRRHPKFLTCPLGFEKLWFDENTIQQSTSSTRCMHHYSMIICSVCRGKGVKMPVWVLLINTFSVLARQTFSTDGEHTSHKGAPVFVLHVWHRLYMMIHFVRSLGIDHMNQSFDQYEHWWTWFSNQGNKPPKPSEIDETFLHFLLL